jgi:hypothetical protein
MPKRERIGAIFTDVAAIMVGDPCKVIPDAGEEPRLTYDDLIAKWEARPRHDTPVAIGKEGQDAIVINTVGNCDGWCWVYVERDKQGSPIRLIVDLSAQGPPPEGGTDGHA